MNSKLRNGVRRVMRWGSIILLAVWIVAATWTIVVFLTVQRSTQWSGFSPPSLGPVEGAQWHFDVHVYPSQVFFNVDHRIWPTALGHAPDAWRRGIQIHPGEMKFRIEPDIPFEGCALPLFPSSTPAPPAPLWERMGFSFHREVRPPRAGIRYWRIDFQAPKWFCIATTSGPLALLPFVPLRRKARERRRLRRGRCVRCDYDLRASAERCPECGTAFPSPAS